MKTKLMAFEKPTMKSNEKKDDSFGIREFILAILSVGVIYIFANILLGLN
jgi:hypothetical protein